MTPMNGWIGFPTALIAVAGLGLAGGCSANSAALARPGASCVPPSLRLFAPRPPAPTELASPLEPGLLSTFGIFRRSAQANDEPRLASGGLARELRKDYELAGYFPALVRRLAEVSGAREYFVVPAFARPEAVPPARCSSASTHRQLVAEQQRRKTDPVACFIEVGESRAAPGPGCEPFVQVDEQLRAFGVSDFVGTPAIEMAPDGVASVRVSYRDVAPFSVPVSENAFYLIPPPAPHDSVSARMRSLLPGLSSSNTSRRDRSTAEWNRTFVYTLPTKIEWLDQGGAVVRVVTPPTRASVAATSLGQLLAPIEGR
jgi:hypothetical protein